jgi:ABC-type transport system involved in multi-copper enzyme maturation permease subunit
MRTIKHIWLKEIKAQLYTWKGTVWFFIAAMLLSFTSYMLLTDRELSLLDQTEMLWLLGKIIVSVGLVIVAIDAASLLSVEFEKETAESLFLAPVSPAAIVWGKLLSSLTLWLMLFIIAIPYMLVSSAGSNLFGAFALYTLLLGSLGIVGFCLLIYSISLWFRSTRNTLTSSLIIIFVLAAPALFTTTMKNNPAAAVFSTINPVDNIFASLDNVLVDYQTGLGQNWQFLLPLLIFCLLALVFMLVSLRHFVRKGIVVGE